MSVVIVLTPVAIAAWPVFATAVTAAAASAGFRLVKDKQKKSTKEPSQEEIPIDMENLDLVGDSLGYDDQLHLCRVILDMVNALYPLVSGFRYSWITKFFLIRKLSHILAVEQEQLQLGMLLRRPGERPAAPHHISLAGMVMGTDEQTQPAHLGFDCIHLCQVCRAGDLVADLFPDAVHGEFEIGEYP